ncbi:hypothetical protein [Kineosporia sp. R_H_3]|uniref:hypothetical protein n=1 Tax=Kineosporia sp. R_H_3 TaxID=1961848 RepID=UPI000B4C1E2B|nr:hypothetical protein [Kineosporia sp. R_H_3]
MTADVLVTVPARQVEHLVRWVLELAVFEHDEPGGRSTVTDPDLIDAVTGLTAATYWKTPTAPTVEEAEARVRALLGLLAGDPEAYRDEPDPDPAPRD